MAAGVLTVYIIHVTVLYVIQGALLGVGLPSIVKLLISGAFAIVVSFLLAAMIRKVPFIKKVLG